VIVPDLALAQRLEFHEAWSSSEHARVQAQLYPETGAISQSIAGGYAVFCGRKSPLSQVYGWGLSRPVLTSDLDTIGTFYRKRGLQGRVRTCPFAKASLRQILGERDYTVHDSMNVYARRMDTLDEAPPTLPGLSIQIATQDDARLWFERSGAGGDWAEPDGMAFMTIRCVLKSNTRLFLAWVEDQPVGGGALEIHEGVAALMAAGTLPEFRNQGIHTALLQARLAAAVEADCDLAMVQTRPGASSQSNVLRAGFQLIYTVNTLVSPG
jgi:GNAT superfamily N-acetyltransferase